jgi:hypothetical protein
VTPNELAASRESLLRKLRKEGCDEYAARLAKCGKPLTLRCTSCTSPREVRTRCDLKWCPSCQPALVARTADRYRRLAADMAWPLVVTFNVVHSRHDTPGLLRDVRRAHTKLRRQRWFRKHVPGGFVAYEVSRLTQDERKKRKLREDCGWHPHAHCLFDCRWLAVTETAPRPTASAAEWKRKGTIACNEVAEIWSDVVGRRGSVNVRRAWKDGNGGIDGAITEIVKYSVKGTDLAEISGPIGPLIFELDRTRQVVPFGSFYGHPNVKRRRSSPAMCKCGCSDWLPEDVLASQAVNEYGLRSPRRR